MQTCIHCKDYKCFFLALLFIKMTCCVFKLITVFITGALAATTEPATDAHNGWAHLLHCLGGKEHEWKWKQHGIRALLWFRKNMSEIQRNKHLKIKLIFVTVFCKFQHVFRLQAGMTMKFNLKEIKGFWGRGKQQNIEIKLKFELFSFQHKEGTTENLPICLARHKKKARRIHYIKRFSSFFPPFVFPSSVC